MQVKSKKMQILENMIRRIIKEEQSEKYGIEQAKEFSGEFEKYIVPNSIKSLSSDPNSGKWYSNWKLKIPKSEFPGEDLASVEKYLKNEIGYSSHGVGGNPGGQYSKCRVGTIRLAGGFYLVDISATGGFDV